MSVGFLSYLWFPQCAFAVALYWKNTFSKNGIHCLFIVLINLFIYYYKLKKYHCLLKDHNFEIQACTARNSKLLKTAMDFGYVFVDGHDITLAKFQPYWTSFVNISS